MPSVRRARSSRVYLENRSGYDTRDLLRFFERAMRACGVRTMKRFVVVTSPIYTRGCATVAPDRKGSVVVIAIAPPSRFSLARLARILEHELSHARGVDHESMKDALLYSDALSVPRWARGREIRYRGRAPGQLGALGKRRMRAQYKV